MPTVNDVITATRRELIAAGLVRHPATEPAGDLPPLFAEPDGGPPAPGDTREDPREVDDTLMVTLRLSTELPEDPGDTGRRRVVLDVVYRSRSTYGLVRARELDARIVDTLVNRADYGLGYVIGGALGDPVYVISTALFAGLGVVVQDAGVTTQVTKIVLETYR